MGHDVFVIRRRGAGLLEDVDRGKAPQELRVIYFRKHWLRVEVIHRAEKLFPRCSRRRAIVDFAATLSEPSHDGGKLHRPSIRDAEVPVFRGTSPLRNHCPQRGMLESGLLILDLAQVGAPVRADLAGRPRLFGKPVNGVVPVARIIRSHDVLALGFELAPRILHGDDIPLACQRIRSRPRSLIEQLLIVGRAKEDHRQPVPPADWEIQIGREPNPVSHWHKHAPLHSDFVLGVRRRDAPLLNHHLAGETGQSRSKVAYHPLIRPPILV